MKTVLEISQDIVRREGGYVNDPDDPGGPTNHGVTLHTMRRLGLDLNQDGVVTASDVKALSQAKAVEIFIDHYYFAPRIDALPQPIQASVFDMHVNAGSNAIRILQRLFNDMGQDVTVDGTIGPHTIRAAYAAFRDAPDYLADAYAIARRDYYYALADRRPASRKYARRRDGSKGGWIKRAEEFLSKHYHLSSSDHRKRVASWG
ncbi:holin-associated N-acetylmuramidase [uncultured Litoreibacter sp.]|uniref:holin-associated N-acetylmuramidase n=1 Tax=uncultured Litoreibacter sp. TaxID=1392394 RepID=UPI0026323406|nr:holin-associated N-acetylmuramidase [uncultured Litoreibacter sp.]